MDKENLIPFIFAIVFTAVLMAVMILPSQIRCDDSYIGEVESLACEDLKLLINNKETISTKSEMICSFVDSEDLTQIYIVNCLEEKELKNE